MIKTLSDKGRRVSQKVFVSLNCGRAKAAIITQQFRPFLERNFEMKQLFLEVLGKFCSVRTGSFIASEDIVS